MLSKTHIQRPETILFVGAGATAALSMPTTMQLAQLLWKICDNYNLNDSEIESITRGAGCFKSHGQDICDLFAVLDGGLENDYEVHLEDDLKERAFPEIDNDTVVRLVRRLRCHYDFAALKLVAKAKKGCSVGNCRAEYLQDVFTLIDVCIREERGFAVYNGSDEIFLTLERLKAAREALILLINTTFACAWSNLMEDSNQQPLLEKYRSFFAALAKVMQEEGRRFFEAGHSPNYPDFYQFSYSLMTTNFEPIFLWFIWQSHKDVNKGNEFRIGNPGRHLRLMMNFPNALGMSQIADVAEGEKIESLDRIIWAPCTDAVAQAVNKESFGGNRYLRFGKYFPLHGMCVTRHCPMCGRLNLYMGDSWDKNSKTLFNNGIISAFNWGQKPRTINEKNCFERGEYDALQCHFCGEITHSYDNFMFMQTQLKSKPPSFIKEITDEALAGIAGAKHIVLLGYSMPLDDAIWGALFTAMSRRKNGERLYCTVVDYVDGEDRDWLMGDDLNNYVCDTNINPQTKSRAITNAITVFGKENVRAYTRGVPKVFGNGTVEEVLKLMYPYKCEGWDIKEFHEFGVERTLKCKE